MESTSIAATAGVPAGAAAGEKGLKSGAIGYLTNMVIAVASTAPAYSLAATLGFVAAVAGMGLHSPAVLIVSFIPMLLIAASYYYMNRADPDCGTTFAWVTRAMGPHLGWLGGWTIVASDVVVMATLAYIAGTYTFLLFGWDSAANSLLAVSIASAVWIVLMTAICTIGIELSARTQRLLLSAEVFTLALFAVVALLKVYISDPAGSIHPELSWFSPFSLPGGWSALVDGVLLGVFIYWGWDSGVVVNEESEDSREGPGKAAVMSTLSLLLIYVVVATAAQAYGGTKLLVDNQSDVLSVLGGKVFGSPLDKLLIIAVLTSAAASTQTTILPTARTTLSMARWGAAASTLGKVHPKYLTPHISTILMGAASLVWTVAVINISQNVLGDSITGLGFLIAFYYGMTGFACAIYYRRELFKSARNFFLVGLAPVVGALMLTGIFVKALIDYKAPDAGYSPAVLGIGTPVVIGVGLLLLGVVLMVITQLAMPKFFRRRTEVADPAVLES